MTQLDTIIGGVTLALLLTGAVTSRQAIPVLAVLALLSLPMIVAIPIGLVALFILVFLRRRRVRQLDEAERLARDAEAEREVDEEVWLLPDDDPVARFWLKGGVDAHIRALYTRCSLDLASESLRNDMKRWRG